MAGLAQAIAHWRLGDASRAELICRALVGGQADATDALGLLAEIYSATGRPEQALSSLRQLARVRPRDAAIHRRLGNVLLECGACADAVPSYQQAIALEPSGVRAHNNLGQAYLRLGRTTEALRSFRRAIELDPSYAIGYVNVGVTLQRQGLLDEALDSYRRALTIDGQMGAASMHCGHALHALGRDPEALDSYNRALELNPNSTEALIGCGNVLLSLRRLGPAVDAYQRALLITPDDSEAHINCACALLELKRPNEALAHCDQVLARAPAFAEAHNNRAGALRQLQRHTESLLACERALAARPGYIDALCNAGKVLREMGEHVAACERFDQAVRLDPAHPGARVGRLMAMIPSIAASAAEARSARANFEVAQVEFESWLQSQPETEPTEIVGALQPFFIAYQETDNRALLSRYGRVCADLMGRWLARHDGAVRPPMAPVTDRIRIGIVSGQVRDHSVYRALTRGWLEQLDRGRFEVGVFHVDVEEDDETVRARERSDFFVAGDRTLAEWVEEIRIRQPQVLLYPEVGMHATTLRLASLRLAPAQAAAWGHPETTGLPTIDYYLSAELFEAAGFERHYRERLLRLPNLGCYCASDGESPQAIDLPALGIDPRRPLLLCAGTPFKYAPTHDDVWVEIARRLPGSQLIFFQPAGGSLSVRLQQRLSTAFASRGMQASEHIVVVPWLSRPRFFGLMRAAKLYLDTLGFSGFNTALQAVECELPMIAYEGRFMRGRLASAIMLRLGLERMVARTPGQYVDLVVATASDSALLDTLRQRLRDSRSVLFNDRAAIDGLQHALTLMAAG